ncbi:MAG: bifunctional DNA primase/polymerase [Rectinema sp.]
MADIPEVFNQPGAGFVTLPAGIKFPPPYKEWQKPENARTYAQAQAHKGNVGVLAGNGYIGLDKDNPPAFDGLSLPTTTTWETRPGRYGLWFKVSDNVAEALQVIGKKTDLAQLYLYRGFRLT